MKDRPSVLFIMHMPPPVHGASIVGSYIHNSDLIKSRYDCHFINPTTARDIEDVGRFRLSKITSVFALLKRIKNKIKEIHPDLVYFTPSATGFAFFKDYLVVKLLKKLGSKILLHYHNKGVSTKQHHFIYNLLYADFFKDVNVILLADNLYNDICKYVDKSSCFCCPNGIPGIDGSVIAEKNNIQNGPFRILFLSNMLREKGVIDLIDACGLLKKRSVSFSCDFVGGWKDVQQEEFERVVLERNLENEIHAHGPKYGSEKESFWNAADVFVFPTYYHNECFPLVLLEAMQHGIACISTNEAGIPGIINSGETGLLVEKRSIDSLADALEKLARNRNLCKDMGRRGRILYEQKFTLQVFEQNLANILNNCLNIDD